MNKINANAVILMVLLAGPVFGQDLLIYLDVKSPSAEGVISYPAENLSLPVPGTDAKDTLTRPWFNAFPILGDYTIAEINQLPKWGPVIRLQAETGKAKRLQRIYGKGGLVLLSELPASGLWRSRSHAPLNSFGVLSIPDKAALSQLAAPVTVGMSVAIKSIAEQNQVRWFHQQTVDYWLSPTNVLVPLPKQFVAKAGLQDAVVLDSDSAQVLTLKIQPSLAQFDKPDAVHQMPFPQINQVDIAVWRLPKKGAAEWVSRQPTNTNPPFIFQQALPNMLKRGDHLIVLCTERLQVQLDSSLDIAQLLSEVQQKLPKTFNLATLKNWVSQQTAEPLVTQMIVAGLVEHALRPVNVTESEVEWTWRSSIKPIQLENRFYPLVRVFIYSV